MPSSLWKVGLAALLLVLSFAVACGRLAAQGATQPKKQQVVIIDQSGRPLASLFSGLRPGPAVRPRPLVHNVNASAACWAKREGSMLAGDDDLGGSRPLACPGCTVCSGECTCTEPVGCGGCNGCCFELNNFREDRDECSEDLGRADCYSECRSVCCLDQVGCIND